MVNQEAINLETTTLEAIMNVRFPVSDKDVTSPITVAVKKTIQNKAYQSETFETHTTLQYNGNLTCLERACVSAIIQASLDFGIYVTCFSRGYIQREEFDTHKTQILKGVLMLLKKLGVEQPESDILALILNQLN